MKANKKTFSRAFTLTELLVTIAIIGILAAILLPVVGKMKMKARRTQSQNNMRHLTVAYLGYELDNGVLMPFDARSNGAWARHIQENEGFSDKTLMSPLCNRAKQRGFGDVNTAWSDSAGDSKYECITRI
ncbi:MAG: prepilin-type N-terminal cleavage/methylation domain-containing protein [Verrucomicrobiota bacterium]|jgi:prepilin-type N-terminal cleavage/methylation domain-containing protein|nr:prepilin-type N-terminal cleavage/methylation domain-containing protein [Verrucomicrobiota bacterium]|tara:strand:- start:495 stop:884 length:390 start_codon:yes stop_codon:yes gene_type:complete